MDWFRLLKAIGIVIVGIIAVLAVAVFIAKFPHGFMIVWITGMVGLLVWSVYNLLGLYER